MTDEHQHAIRRMNRFDTINQLLCYPGVVLLLAAAIVHIQTRSVLVTTILGTTGGLLFASSMIVSAIASWRYNRGDR